MYKLKLFILILLGLSGPLSMFVFGYNYFFFISPAPSVFTYQNRYKSQISFIRFSDTQKIDELIMDRSFYQKLSGPHRYKVLFNSVMKRGARLVINPKYKNFVENFICKFQSQSKVTKVHVVTKKKSLKVFSCND